MACTAAMEHTTQAEPRSARVCVRVFVVLEVITPRVYAYLPLSISLLIPCACVYCLRLPLSISLLVCSSQGLPVRVLSMVWSGGVILW